MYFLQCLDASHELEGVMTRIVSTDITVEGTLLNQDTRSMVQHSKVGITRPVVDGALVLEYEDMFTGKRSKLSRSQCLCPGLIEVPVKPDRVVRSRGRSGMGSNIAWHRRHNDSVD